MKKAKAERLRFQHRATPRHGEIIDLMQALKQSIEKAKPKQKTSPAQRKRKTASSEL
jgi:non-homologous end joining protein Ku